MTTFSFGAPTSQPATGLFGQPTTSQPPNLGTFPFNTSGATATTSSMFNFGGTATTTQAAFGATTTTTSTPFTFNFPTTTSAPSSSAFAFGGLGSAGTGQFGQTATGLSLFGQTRLGGPTQFSFGQPQQSQQVSQQPQPTPQQILTTIFSPKLFNDERDEIIGQFNKVQAFWGTGKAYYAVNAQPFELNHLQSAHRFKAIGYADIHKDEHDLEGDKIGIIIKKQGNDTQLRSAILQYEGNLKSILGPNSSPKVEGTKILPGDKALLTISVIDTSTNKKVTSAQLLNHLNQANIKSQLNGAFLGAFLQLISLAPPSKHEIAEYLNNPPMGIDRLLWNQAKLENPDSTRFMPVPLVGFAAVNDRFKLQERETQQQKQRLKILTDDVNSLERGVTATKSKLEECKRKHITLSNRVLKILVQQEVLRKRGFPIQAEEDQLRAKLEGIQAEINAPTKFQGCLNELMSRLRQMQNQCQSSGFSTVEESTLDDIRKFLNQEQEGISHLISILKDDLKDYNELQKEPKC